MRGLRTQEGEKFEKFFDIVQQKASQSESVFFLDAGEGNDFETETMEGENLRGWLIPKHQAAAFDKLFKDFEIGDEWLDLMCWAEWEQQNDIISVKFNWY